MPDVAAVSALGVMVTLVLSRPRIGPDLRVGPVAAVGAGVLIMLAAGHVGWGDMREAGEVLWRPLVAISSIMVTAAAAVHLGVVDRLAATIFPYARGSVTRLYLLVFALSAAVAAVLNNDSAILLLTPVVVVLIRRLYPGRDGLLIPFVFAVFMAAGVAPLMTSNPMNLIVAEYAGLGFNAYAMLMAPIAVVSWLTTYLILRWLFRRELASAPAELASIPTGERWRPVERHGLILVIAVLGAYPVVSALGGSVWIVATAGAATAALLCRLHGVTSVENLVRTGIAWGVLVFLLGSFTLALGLRNAGAVEWLTELYTTGGTAVIGFASAGGSAIINNHSMALINLLAIEATPGSDQPEFLAALIGGDLGPRLLPIGSLAALLWFAVLRRLGVEVPIRQFVLIGIAVTLPSLALSLGTLELLT